MDDFEPILPPNLPPSTTSFRKRIGRCIYCFANGVPLSDEHVYPEGLNGTLVLESASCNSCSTITSRFEEIVLRKTLVAPRIALGMKSKRNKIYKDLKKFDFLY